jgi:hypothetical protein
MNEQLLTHVVSVKVTRETMDQIKEAAFAEQKSVATFLRDRIEIAIHNRQEPLLAPRRLEPWRAL